MWNIDTPDDFSQFTAADFPQFLDWWERQQAEAMSATLAGAFVEGIAQPWLEALGEKSQMPEWVKAMLRWRLAAMWAYQQAVPLSAKLNRGIDGLVGALPEGQQQRFGVSPVALAEVPPQIRQAFIEGNRFSMGWINKLSQDARDLTGDLLSLNTLQARNPLDAVPTLENILRRELLARETMASPGSITPTQLDDWTAQASEKVLRGIAHRAQMIARTEQMRMMNLGALSSMEEQGKTLCYVMPHAGSCPECQRLLDGRVFRVAVLKRNLFENFGKPKHQWVASVPQHPQCRHSVSAVPWRFKKILKTIPVPDEGILLQWYGRDEHAFNAWELPRHPWLLPDGTMG